MYITVKRSCNQCIENRGKIVAATADKKGKESIDRHKRRVVAKKRRSAKVKIYLVTHLSLVIRTLSRAHKQSIRYIVSRSHASAFNTHVILARMTFKQGPHNA